MGMLRQVDRGLALRRVSMPLLQPRHDPPLQEKPARPRQSIRKRFSKHLHREPEPVPLAVRLGEDPLPEQRVESVQQLQLVEAKDAGPDELAAAIETVHAGGSLVKPVMASRLLDRFGELATRERLPEALTEREVEVLRLVASGSRNREIAERLVVSEKTVKYHLGQVYAKLAVTGRTEAVARARELGILPLDALSRA